MRAFANEYWIPAKRPQEWQYLISCLLMLSRMSINDFYVTQKYIVQSNYARVHVSFMSEYEKISYYG